ncbi:TetR family transcriptional regulator [Mycolicibacterium conceptionense]|uniref:TetR family transcriptional regulator n=1 Tax=Mycolicibacterium conceptionense TaxID=451644 RepID=A0A0U1DDW1_9MYCO|nr:TetR family transcriptional regulator [Mycolicibacterium conceptionense]
MTDRALREFVVATPYVEAKDWRESLANHARTMRKASWVTRFCVISFSFGRP